MNASDKLKRTFVYDICGTLDSEGECFDCCVKGEHVIDRVHPKIKAKYG